eukprot:scaffold13277_cov114-Isochrysis_galbana.AAC.6
MEEACQRRRRRTLQVRQPIRRGQPNGPRGLSPPRPQSMPRRVAPTRKQKFHGKQPGRPLTRRLAAKRAPCVHGSPHAPWRRSAGTEKWPPPHRPHKASAVAPRPPPTHRPPEAGECRLKRRQSRGLSAEPPAPMSRGAMRRPDAEEVTE